LDVKRIGISAELERRSRDKRLAGRREAAHHLDVVLGRLHARNLSWREKFGAAWRENNRHDATLPRAKRYQLVEDGRRTVDEPLGVHAVLAGIEWDRLRGPRQGGVWRSADRNAVDRNLKLCCVGRRIEHQRRQLPHDLLDAQLGKTGNPRILGFDRRGEDAFELLEREDESS